MFNKKFNLFFFSLLFISLFSFSSFAYNLTSNISADYKDLSLYDKYLCTYDEVEDMNNDVGIEMKFYNQLSMQLFSASNTFFGDLFGLNNPREQYCLALIGTIESFKEENNITNEYDFYSAENSNQLGLEEYFYIREKEQILANTNTAWIYVLLIMVIVKEIILLLFYTIQLYLVIHILFILIPNIFLKMRDSMLLFVFKAKEKKEAKKKKISINIFMK